MRPIGRLTSRISQSSKDSSASSFCPLRSSSCRSRTRRFLGGIGKTIGETRYDWSVFLVIVAVVSVVALFFLGRWIVDRIGDYPW